MAPLFSLAKGTTMLTAYQCPWMDPFMGYTALDCLKDNHGDHKVKPEPRVYCACLIPPGQYVQVWRMQSGKTYTHKGTEKCCSDFCPECGIRACFVCNCGNYGSY